MIPRRAVLRAALGIPLLALPALGAAGADANLIVGQGDSLTSAWPGYIGLVAAALGRPVINRAINGSALRDAQAAAWLDPTLGSGITISLCGYNDLRRYGSDPATLAGYELMLQGAAALARQRGPVALGGCLTMTPEGWALHPGEADRGSDAGAAAYSAIVRRVCARVGATYVDLSGYDPYTMMQDDLTHPNTAGNRWIADQVISAVNHVVLPAINT